MQSNPARWRGHDVENMLPRRSRVRATAHHAALPYTEVAEFLEQLRAQNTPAAAALEFTILTSVRTGETLSARWSEIDIAAAIWTIPAERTKTGQEHRVPLSEQALAVLESASDDRNRYLFSSGHGRRLNASAMLLALRQVHPTATVHGFRSTFRDWAAEQTNFAREVCERALSHTIGGAVEAAYARGDLFEKRRQLMAAWGRYCETRQTGRVVSLR